MGGRPPPTALIIRSSTFERALTQIFPVQDDNSASFRWLLNPMIDWAIEGQNDVNLGELTNA